MMKNDDRQILDWVIQKIQTEYRDDIALLLGHGHTKPPNTKDADVFKSEIDYFVPDNDDAYALSKSFIVDGVGYDLYPRSWESIESMAALNDMHTGCLADAQILYARSDKDRKRFESIRAKLFGNLKDDRLAHGKAVARLNMAKEIYQTMLFSQKEHEIRVSAGFILDYLAQSVALMNGSYFKRGSLYQLEEMNQFKQQPEAFARIYNQIVFSQNMEDMKRMCYEIIFDTQCFLAYGSSCEAVVHRLDFRGLADWYQEMESTWRKIYSGCEQQDATRVFFLGCKLQHELDIIKAEFGLAEMDLLSHYDGKQLADMHTQAKEIEKYIVDVIIKNSVQVAIYSTVEEFLTQN